MNQKVGIALLGIAVLFAGLRGVAAGDFNLVDIEGNTQTLEAYRGKWVVVNFWATWCPPCLEEIPELIAFHDNHHDRDAVVLGVNYEDISKMELMEFVDDHLISYPVIQLPSSARTPLGPIDGLPTTFLVDPQGRTVAQQPGAVTAEEIENYINKHGAKGTGT